MSEIRILGISPHNNIMPRGKVSQDCSENRIQEDPQESRLSVALAAILNAFEADLSSLLVNAGEYSRHIERSLDAITLLTKEEAAKRMNVSVATLDRKVAKGEIEVTYLDRRVRFKLSEVQRFIDLRTGPLNRQGYR